MPFSWPEQADFERFARRDFTGVEPEVAIHLASAIEAVKQHVGTDGRGRIERTELHTVTSPAAVWVLERPCTALGAVELDGVAQTGVRLDHDGRLWRAVGWPVGATVEVTYTGGPDLVPDNWRIVVLGAALRSFDNPLGLASQGNPDGMSGSYQLFALELSRTEKALLGVGKVGFG